MGNSNTRPTASTSVKARAALHKTTSNANLVSAVQFLSEHEIRCRLSDAPEAWIQAISQCVRLLNNRLSVQLSGLALTALPEWLRLKGLEQARLVVEMDLSKNCLTKFPLEVTRFRGLERLALGSNDLRRIPDEIGLLQELVWFDFTHNQIGQVSENLGDLKNLVSLGASDCRLSAFPRAITRLKNLRKLGCFNNLFTELPSEIGSLVMLTKLDLSGNQLRTLPPEIGKLTQLTWLNISHNRIEKLPDEMGNLVHLQEFGACHNRLCRLPNLGRLVRLTVLTAFNNELEEIGEWIVGCQCLVKLDLSTNRLTSLPKGILCLPKLELLNVRGNQLVELPPYNPKNYNELPKQIKFLDLRDNQLLSLPHGAFGVHELLISENPLYMEHHQYRDYIPSLRMAALSSILSQYTIHESRSRLIRRLPAKLAQECHEVWIGDQGFVCQHCESIFVHPPFNLIIWRRTFDGLVPLVHVLCSGECRRTLRSKSENDMQYYMGDRLATPPDSDVLAFYGSSRVHRESEGQE